jgi:hypothetical protein
VADDVDDVYGGLTDHHPLGQRDDFKPWHYPVKQVVREWQWVDLTRELLDDHRGAETSELHYFTLPGPDLLDVRALARECMPRGVRISYFGFDSSWDQDEDEDAGWTTAESVLRQGGLISDDAVIHQDRLEDLALDKSHAATQLRQRLPFDVVNVDACSHLAHDAEGRPSLFDALQVLLTHQLGARQPWLLFITTRVDPDLLDASRQVFAKAIGGNLDLPGTAFREALAACLSVDAGSLPENLDQIWASSGETFLRLYTVGLGKFLLQFFHGQPNLRARVELASSYAYRVSTPDPNMLALAFRIIPDAPIAVALPPTTGGPTTYPLLEPVLATKIVSRASRLWDLDQGIETDDDARRVAYDGSADLLAEAGYDTAKWSRWVDEHVRRQFSGSSQLSQPSEAADRSEPGPSANG